MLKKWLFLMLHGLKNYWKGSIQFFIIRQVAKVKFNMKGLSDSIGDIGLKSGRIVSVSTEVSQALQFFCGGDTQHDCSD